MISRPQLAPALDECLVRSDLDAHLASWQADTVATTRALGLLRARIDESQRLLESPSAVVEHVEFFITRLTRLAVDLEAVRAGAADAGHEKAAQRLRRMAAEAAADERHVVGFRDKWINKPLPHEQVRPLLDEIAATIGAQLTDYRALTAAADRLDALSSSPAHGEEVPAPSTPDRGFDRRALFNRLLKPERGGSQ